MNSSSIAFQPTTVCMLLHAIKKVNLKSFSKINQKRAQLVKKYTTITKDKSSEHKST